MKASGLHLERERSEEARGFLLGLCTERVGMMLSAESTTQACRECVLCAGLKTVDSIIPAQQRGKRDDLDMQRAHDAAPMLNCKQQRT